MGCRRMVVVWSLAVAFVLPIAVGRAAAADDDIRADLAQAQQEIRQLRAELSELKSSAAWQYRRELGEALNEVPSAAKDSGPGGLILPAGWSIQPYGYIKLDMAYDDSGVGAGSGEFAGWALPEDRQTRSDDRFSITARQTRLGANIFAPNIGDVKVKGVVETDFYGPTSPAAVTRENQASLRFRRGFGLLTGSDWSFLFGQEWEVLSPLFPHVLNYLIGSYAGNAGYRSPQATLSKWWQCDQVEGGMLKVQASLQREISQDIDLLGVDDGQDASMPTVLGRVSYSAPFVGEKRAELGVSGHFGEEEIDWDDRGGAINPATGVVDVATNAAAGADEDVHTWSVNADLVLPLAEEFEVRGEYYWAENYDWPHAAGLGYGVNTVTGDEVEAMGGWAQVAYQPAETPWKFVVGFGFEDPIDADLLDGQRSMNHWYFGNVMYNFSKYLSTGFEASYFQTDYKGARIEGFQDGDNMRFQHSWILKF